MVVFIGAVGAAGCAGGQDDEETRIESSNESASTTEVGPADATGGGSVGETGDSPVATEPIGETGDATDSTEPTGETGDATVATEPAVDQPAVDGVTFSDAMLETAIAAGEADPLDGLPGDDDIATEALVGELTEAGYDLTGMRVTVYPAGSAPSFMLFETDDSSALVNADDGGDAFVMALLESPVLADSGVEQLVMQHSGTDDEGPFVITFLIPLDELRSAADGTTDISESIAVQVDRP